LRQAFILFLLFNLIFLFSCRTRNTEFVTIGLSEKFSTLDTLTSPASDAAAERVRNLIFNGLVKKNEKFEYVGDLAKDIQTSADGKAITFVLQDNVKFHNGNAFTSADVKYTFDELFKADKAFKAGAFYETVNDQKVPHIVSIETPDPKTVVFTLSRPSLRNQLLSNLVAIPIIASGTIDQQKTAPIGSGAFKFVSFDQAQNVVELAGNPDYFDGAPKVQKLRVKTVPDANSMQAELQSGGVDIAPLPTNLSPDTLKSLGQVPTLKVEQFAGSNIQYIGFNTTSAPLDKAKVRQAIGYAIDREKIIKELLSGQATLAFSILPEGSWAFNAGTKYTYDPNKAKQLLQESGYKNEPIKFSFTAGQQAVSQYVQVIQNALTEIGLNIQLDPLDGNALRTQLGQGQFQMSTGIFVGGNQDPIFLHDLFSSTKIPTPKTTGFNRSRYSNPEYDKTIEQAFNEPDRAKAKELYLKAQEIVSSDLPLFPLWYPANMVVYNKRIGNIKISPSGDWSFVKDVTVGN
jgi:peptide/nickel transport system substrate-binding protein